MQLGTRVIFWDDAGTVKLGAVQSFGSVDVRLSPAMHLVARLTRLTLRGFKSHLSSSMVFRGSL